MWRQVSGLVILTVVFGGCGEIEVTSKHAGSVAGAEALLDTVPGLAKFDEASVTRDEQIAAYQAWLRADHARGCMEAAGLEYWPELLYPADEAAHFDAVGLTDPIKTAEADDSETRNRSYRDTLSRARLDSYYRTLMGEALEVVEYLEASGGELPVGHEGDFGVGGCVGDALGAIGRIWDFRDRMGDALDTARSNVRQSRIMTEASSALETCARAVGVPGVTGPGALEQQYASGSASYAQFKEIETTCVSAWIEVERKALIEADNEFYADHEDEMLQQIKKYGPLYDRSRDDASFASAVAALIAGVS